MEFAQAAASLGLRAIHGAEMALEDGRHVTLLVEDATGWRNLCRIVTAAHEHDRDKTEPPPHGPARDARAARRRARLPERLRAPGRPRRAGPAAAAADLRRRPPAGRAPAPLPPRRPRPQPPPRRAGRAPRRAGRGHGQRPRAHPLAGAAAGRLRRPAQPRHARRLGAHAPRQLLPRARLPGGDGGALRGPPARGRRDARARRPPDLRPQPGPRLPLPRRRGPGGQPHARRAVRAALRGALPARQPAPRRGAPAPGGGAAGDRRARAARLLPPAPRHARARARGRRRGARARLGARAAAAGARPRLLGVLDRLLPHRPLAHRPDRQRAVPRALPQRGADGAAGHRPRLPARHPRGPDPARARPLRARALGAGGGLPDLPLARVDPRARQGARAAGRRARARRPRVGAVRDPRRGGGRRERARDRARRAAGAVAGSGLARAVRDVDGGVAGAGQRPRPVPVRVSPAGRGGARGSACPAAGRGWRGCATRPTGCRATSPSTRAG